MRKNKAIKKQAKMYARMSLDRDGFVDQEKVQAFVEIIQNDNESQSLSLLKAYRNELEALIEKYTARISSAVQLSQEEVEKVAGQLSKSAGRKIQTEVDVNPELISGIKVQLFDTIYENSVIGKMNQIKERISG